MKEFDRDDPIQKSYERNSPAVDVDLGWEILKTRMAEEKGRGISPDGNARAPVTRISGKREQASLPKAPARKPRKTLRMAAFASIAVILVAAITVGSLEAVKHLGNDQPILVITDDTTGVSPGSTGQAAQSAESVPSAAMFRGNAARTGVYPSGGPTNQPDLLWKFKTGEREATSPVVSDGVVYVAGGWLGDMDGYLYALDARSGEEKWKFPWFPTPSFQPPCPAVSEGVVYIGGNSEAGYPPDIDSDGGYLYALDAASGQERWKFQTFSGATPSPAVSDGMVYFGTEDDGNSYLYALDAASGQQKWRFELVGVDDITGSPAVADGVAYFSDKYGYLYALDAQTGQEKWTLKPGYASGAGYASGPDASPVVSEGVVYFWASNALYGYLHALDAQTGEEKWTYEATGTIRSSPAVSGGVVYLLHEVRESEGWPEGGALFVALDATSGRELWQFWAANTVCYEPWSSPSISGNVVYFGTCPLALSHGRLHALDASTGEELWTWVTGAGLHGHVASSSPAISDGVVYFSGIDGYLYALK